MIVKRGIKHSWKQKRKHSIPDPMEYNENSPKKDVYVNVDNYIKK